MRGKLLLEGGEGVIFPDVVQLQPVAVRDAVPPSWPAKKARTSLRNRLRHDQENAHSAGKTTTMRPFRRERRLTRRRSRSRHGQVLGYCFVHGRNRDLAIGLDGRPCRIQLRDSGRMTVRIRSMVDDQNLVPVALAPSWLRTSLTLVSSGPAGPPDARGRWQRSRCSSGRCAAAVDSEDRAVNEAGVVGSQIGDRCGDLVR